MSGQPSLPLGILFVATPLAVAGFMLRLVLCWCRYADTQEEKARKLAKKAVVPPASHSPFDLLQSIAAGHYQMIDGMHPGLPAGFTAFSASGVPDGNGKCSHTRGSAAFLLLCTLHVAVESAYKSCIWMLMLTAKHPCMSSSTTHSTSGQDAVCAQGTNMLCLYSSIQGIA